MNVQQLREKYLSRSVLWRFFWVLFANILMGASVGVLFVADMGSDPLSTFSRGLSMVLPVSYGNCQLLVNIVLIIVMLLFERHLIGAGTIINMVLIGYIAEFTEGLLRRAPFIGAAPGMPMRIAAIVVGLVLFVMTVAVYMTAELGTSPYDALPVFLSSKLPFSFQVVRISFDLLMVCLGWLFGNTPGIVTVLMVLTIGPVVSWFGKHVANRLFKKETSFV